LLRKLLKFINEFMLSYTVHFSKSISAYPKHLTAIGKAAFIYYHALFALSTPF